MEYLKSHIVSIFVISLVAILSIGSFFIDINSFKDTIVGSGAWAPVLYILAKISTVVFAPLSGTVLYVFSVPLFGFWKGVLYSFIGDLIGAVITFYLSRIFGRQVISYFAGKKNMVRIEDTLELMGTKKGFVTMRLAALSMPEIASYAAGLTPINFLFFITVHMAIDIIPILVITSPGLFFTQNIPAWLVTIGAILAILVTVGSIAVFGFMLRREHKKRQERMENIEASLEETISAKDLPQL